MPRRTGMMKIIDVHAHILPGVDDGSENWNESIEMLRMAYEQGIRTIIATPHYHQGQDIERLKETTGISETGGAKTRSRVRYFFQARN
mgnify:CR=1 FL=1